MGVLIKCKNLVFAIFFVLMNVAHASDFELVWLTSSKGEIFEKEWIRELLSSFEFEEREATDLRKLKNPSIIIPVATSLTSGHQRALKRYQTKGIRIGAFHLSDEWFNHNTDWYPLTQFVFRNCFHKKYTNISNVEFFPLGSKVGFKTNLEPKHVKKFAERQYVWSFMGQVTKSNRPVMMRFLRKLKAPSFTHFNANFNGKDGLDIASYQNILLDSKFSPCPTGFSNPDTFRLYESLESGCIPIVEDPEGLYFSSLYKNPPFLILKNWSELGRLIKPYLNDDEAAEAKRLECFKWWQQEKSRVKASVTKKVKELIEQN